MNKKSYGVETSKPSISIDPSHRTQGKNPYLYRTTNTINYVLYYNNKY